MPCMRKTTPKSIRLSINGRVGSSLIFAIKELCRRHDNTEYKIETVISSSFEDEDFYFSDITFCYCKNRISEFRREIIKVLQKEEISPFAFKK